MCNFRKFNFSCPTGMELVAAPTRNTNFTFRSADVPQWGDSSGDPTTYTPGVWNELHLRVAHHAAKYIGLLLYAVQADAGAVDEDENLIETPIGEWDVSGSPEHFSASPACGGLAVTHVDASPKRMHHRFYWRAPGGAGRVTFRLLLKWGETNGGSFYWPMTGGDLTLDEGDVVPDADARASWVAAAPDETCDAAGAARGGARAAAALAAAAARAARAAAAAARARPRAPRARRARRARRRRASRTRAARACPPRAPRSPRGRRARSSAARPRAWRASFSCVPSRLPSALCRELQRAERDGGMARTLPALLASHLSRAFGNPRFRPTSSRRSTFARPRASARSSLDACL